jgi:hypothetical protein
LQTDQPNVALVTWKRAEDGDGTILRFLELAGKPEEVNIETPLLNVQSAWSGGCSGAKPGCTHDFAPWVSFLRKTVSDRHGAGGGNLGG